MKPKILLFDIETKPVKVWVWRTGKQYVRHPQIVTGEKFDIICICYKWAHEKTVYALDWGIRKQDSAKMIDKFVEVVEEADVVIGQNSDSFDIKQVNTQRLLHGQPPIAWPTSEDTMKQIRKHFYVTSSSLDYMSKLLTGSGKDRMEFQDWVDIVERKDPKALSKMIKYCKKDVVKMQQVWEQIAPYVDVTAHRGLIVGGKKQDCPSCGHGRIIKDGYRYLKAGTYHRLRCTRCAHLWKGPKRAI